MGRPRKLDIPVAIVECACGCGELIKNIDTNHHHYRLRKYKRGHNSKTLEMRQKISLRFKGKKIDYPRHVSIEQKEKLRVAFLGRHHTLETKQKMSLQRRGKKLNYSPSYETRQKMREKKLGRKLSKDTKELLTTKLKERWSNPEYKTKLSAKYKKWWGISVNREKRAKQITDSLPRGEQSSAWRGGLSFLPYTKDFNKQLKIRIRDRDNHICQLCGMSEIENKKSLTVHHIDYDKANCRDDNLISLCVSCNSKVNVNREYWVSYFMTKINNKYQEVLI